MNEIAIQWCRWCVGVVAASTVLPAVVGATEFTIDNKSEVAIQSVYVAPEKRDLPWNERDSVIQVAISPGSTRNRLMAGPGCKFDILLTTEGAIERLEYLGRDLCDDPVFVFPKGDQLTILNEGEAAVYFVRVSLDHEVYGWGEDLLGDREILSQGGELVVRLHPKGQCLFDVQLEEDDDSEHVYTGVDVCRSERLVHPQAPPGGEHLGWEDLAAGDTFRDCEDWGCPWMVVVDGGEFERGSQDRDEETPVTDVTVPGPFAVGQFEVSVGQFQEFVRDTDHDGGNRCHIRKGNRWRLTDGRNWRNPGFDQDDSHPVVCVNWDDAIAYTNWLQERTGLPYRLLSEAEAEWLAKTSTMDFERSGRANCRNCGSHWDGKSTSPVGRLGPDELGLSDVFGNAAEWVQDCYQSGYSNAPRDGSAWSPASCEKRVVRGGCWATRAEELRASGRDYGNSGRRSTCVGFRMARDI